MLLCGGSCKNGRSGFLVVLDSDSMTCQHTLRLDPGHFVARLRCVRGGVWGILRNFRLKNNSVVVWGKAARGEGSGMSEAGRA